VAAGHEEQALVALEEEAAGAREQPRPVEGGDAGGREQQRIGGRRGGVSRQR
jgi:hypothetical protein